MNFNEFEKEFVPFCITPGVDSGKAKSYYLAIKYLAEYLSVNSIDKDSLAKIFDRTIQNGLSSSDSSFYQNLLEHLKGQMRSSYLKKGFISAALRYLRDFAELHRMM